MGQSLLSLLSTPATPDAAKAEPKPRAEAPETTEKSLFSLFLKRREEGKAERRGEPRADHHAAPRPAEGKDKAEDAPAADREADDAIDESAARDQSDSDSHEAAVEVTDKGPEETQAADQPAEPESADAADLELDTQIESMMMGFWAGQVPPAPPSPAGVSGDAAIAANATSAPAPILMLSDATPALNPQPATPGVIETSQPPADFAALLGSGEQVLPGAPQAVQLAQPGALALPAGMEVTADDVAPAPLAELVKRMLNEETTLTPQPTGTDAEAESETVTSSFATDPSAMPAPARRLGRQDPVTPAGPAPAAAHQAVPVSPVAVAMVNPGNANPTMSASEGDVAPVDATNAKPVEPTALPGPAGLQTQAANATKFELASADNATPSAQILAHVATLPKGKGTQFNLQLEPLHLGKVEVVMSIQRDGALHMQIQAESKEALAALQRDAVQLERSLQDLGLKTDGGSLQFSLKQESDQNSAFAQFHQQSGGQGGQPGRAQGPSAIDAQPAPRATIAYRAVSADGLDIHV